MAPPEDVELYINGTRPIKLQNYLKIHFFSKFGEQNLHRFLLLFNKHGDSYFLF